MVGDRRKTARTSGLTSHTEHGGPSPSFPRQRLTSSRSSCWISARSATRVPESRRRSALRLASRSLRLSARSKISRPQSSMQRAMRPRRAFRSRSIRPAPELTSDPATSALSPHHRGHPQTPVRNTLVAGLDGDAPPPPRYAGTMDQTVACTRCDSRRAPRSAAVRRLLRLGGSCPKRTLLIGQSCTTRTQLPQQQGGQQLERTHQGSRMASSEPRSRSNSSQRPQDPASTS